MTDEEVIRVLAEHEGIGTKIVIGITPKMPSYLTSKDALQPVLGKLSQEEWVELGTNLQSAYPSLIDSLGELQFWLALSAKDLAHAIAESIIDCAED